MKKNEFNYRFFIIIAIIAFVLGLIHGVVFAQSTHHATITNLVDADTFDAKVEVEVIDATVNRRLRVKGFDAPEVRTKDLAEKAKGLAMKQKAESILLNRKVLLTVYGKDAFGRLLVDVKVNGEDFKELIQSKGE